jgi:two-component system, NtrC family, response regulator AtoC
MGGGAGMPGSIPQWAMPRGGGAVYNGAMGAAPSPGGWNVAARTWEAATVVGPHGARGEPAANAREGRRGKGDASERDRILDALERCAGNQTKAARLLGISRRTLVARLEQYELPRPRKGSPR